MDQHPVAIIRSHFALQKLELSATGLLAHRQTFIVVFMTSHGFTGEEHLLHVQGLSPSMRNLSLQEVPKIETRQMFINQISFCKTDGNTGRYCSKAFISVVTC